MGGKGCQSFYKICPIILALSSAMVDSWEVATLARFLTDVFLFFPTPSGDPDLNGALSYFFQFPADIIQNYSNKPNGILSCVDELIRSLPPLLLSYVDLSTGKAGPYLQQAGRNFYRDSSFKF